MKIQIKKFTSRLALTFLVLLAASICGTGCATQPHPDPLAGWKSCDSNQLDVAIKDDCQNYIHGLPPKKWQFVNSTDFFENGVGQHAASIIIGINGTWWKHILIYDKDNKRIKVIKYSTGYYRS